MNKKTFCVLLAVMFCLLPGISHARYLNTANGRFQTMDTFQGDRQDPQTLHKYGYCQNNPVNGIDPLGLWENTDFGNRVQEVITDDFIEKGNPRQRDGNRALGTMVGQPSIGPLALRPDLYQNDGRDNFFYEIKSTTPAQIAAGLSKVARYNSYLNYYGPWRPGSSLDYIFWKASTGPVIKTDRQGNPLPGGCIAVVLPPAGGLMLYQKIDPKKVPRQFVDFIVADILAFSEVSIETGVAVETTELTQATAWLSSVTTTATAAAEVGEATTITLTIDLSEAEVFAAEGVY